MSKYKRPWWLLVNKPAGLITTIHEESTADERVFIIRGEPLVQGLAWLTWGPIAALAVIIVLTGLAINLNVKAQDWGVRSLFIAAFLGLPALAWGLATIIANLLAKKHVQAERLAETQECHFRLNQKRGEFVYQTTSSPQEKLAYEHIHEAQVTPAIGARDSKLMRLTLDTEQGPITLLNEVLGTQAQKSDLACEINASLKKKSVTS